MHDEKPKTLSDSFSLMLTICKKRISTRCRSFESERVKSTRPTYVRMYVSFEQTIKIQRPATLYLYMSKRYKENWSKKERKKQKME